MKICVKKKARHENCHIACQWILYNKEDPSRSFNVYIDKDPSDTIPIKYKTIQDEITEGQSDTLIYILEGGHRGFHKFSEGALIGEYKDMEEKFYRLYEDGELPYELYDDDHDFSDP